jgi:hypothetical protein
MKIIKTAVICSIIANSGNHKKNPDDTTKEIGVVERRDTADEDAYVGYFFLGLLVLFGALIVFSCVTSYLEKKRKKDVWNSVFKNSGDGGDRG